MYKYDYHFVKDHIENLGYSSLKFNAPVQKNDIIQVTPKNQRKLLVSDRKIYQFVVVNVTHMNNGISFLMLRKALEEDFN
jgi:hypothetical protein